MLRSSFLYGIGVLPSHILGSIGPLLTRSLLSGLGSLGAVGLLGVASRFTSPLTILAAAFSTAYLPIYLSFRVDGTAEGREKLVTAARAVWWGVALCVIGVSLFGPPAVVLLTPPEYHGAAELIPVLAVGFLGQAAYALFVPEIVFSKKTYFFPLITVATIAVNTSVIYFTAESHGAIGAAWATSGGFLASALAGAIISLCIFRMPYDWISLLRTTIIGGGSLAFGLLVSQPSPWLQLLVASAAVLLFLLLSWVLREPTIVTVIAAASQWLAERRERSAS